MFASTTLLSAFLLFQVQPLISKAILPWFGGGPGVWTTAMLFFQMVLLAGYAYAHLVSVRLSRTTQALVHCAVLILAMTRLPILPDASFKPLHGEEPIARILLILSLAVGLPYFALSTTGPLLQRWFSVLVPGRSPYTLYALSNLGSLLALLTYPTLFEPVLDTAHQAWAWSSVFVLFAMGAGACALVPLARGPARFDSARQATPAPLGPEPITEAQAAAPRKEPGAREYALWFGLSVVPSAMLLATTNQLCIDVATVPFLWIGPLTVYLLSFILCFGQVRVYRRGPFTVLWLLATAALCAELVAPTVGSIPTQIGVFLAALGACAMICHGELAQRQPDPRHLTAFYLTMSAGGAVGGLLVAVVAPTVFQGYYELHLAIFGCYALLTWILLQERHTGSARMPLLFTVVGIASTSLGLLGAATVGGGDGESGRTLARSRNFYGVLRVAELKDARILTHGRIWHGIQFTDSARRLVPTLYYTQDSGIGQLLTSLPSHESVKVGVVGLGVGTLLHYAKASDLYRFYEIDPDVIRMAREYFTFLRDAPAHTEVVLGDARISLEEEAPNGFDVLALDAFSSDSVPAHLLTVEAFELYLRHLKANGVLAFHLSNRHLDLKRVVAGAAERLGLSMRIIQAQADPERIASASTWALLARSASRLPATTDVAVPVKVVWTDTHNALFEVLQD